MATPWLLGLRVSERDARVGAAGSVRHGDGGAASLLNRARTGGNVHLLPSHELGGDGAEGEPPVRETGRRLKGPVCKGWLDL